MGLLPNEYDRMNNFKKKVIEKTDDLLIKTFDKEFLEEPIFTDPNYFENIAKEIIPEESIPQFKKEYDGDEQMYQDLIEYKYKELRKEIKTQL